MPISSRHQNIYAAVEECVVLHAFIGRLKQDLEGLLLQLCNIELADWPRPLRNKPCMYVYS